MELSELQVKLYHENCWTAKLPEIFPNCDILYPFSRNHSVRGTVTRTMTKATKGEIKNLVQSNKFSRFNPRIVGAVSSTKNSQTYIVSFLFTQKNSVYGLVSGLKEVILTKVSYKEGYEIWNFVMPNRGMRERAEIIKGGIESVASIEGIKIISQPDLMKENITDYLRFYLPSSTYFLINSLSKIGYFDLPRKVSIEDAAQILGISKGFISKVSRRIFTLFREP